MNHYEGMFIVRPDLSDEDKKNLFAQINDAVTKNNGSVSAANIWSEKRRMCFRIKKCDEGVYYLISFSAAAEALAKITHAYKLNENILRVLITKAK